MQVVESVLTSTRDNSPGHEMATDDEMKDVSLMLAPGWGYREATPVASDAEDSDVESLEELSSDDEDEMAEGSGETDVSVPPQAGMSFLHSMIDESVHVPGDNMESGAEGRTTSDAMESFLKLGMGLVVLV